MKKIVLLLLVGIICSFTTYTPKTIYIQPLGDVNQEYLTYVQNSATDFYGYTCVIQPKINLTKDLLAAMKPVKF